MAKISFFIHTSIVDEITEVLPDSVKPWVRKFEATEKTLFQSSQMKFESDMQYSVVMLPGTWCHSKWTLPAEMSLKCIQGTLRVVFWNAEVYPHWSVPLTLVPKDLPIQQKALIINHICRVPAWGLQSIMPTGAKIYTERVRTQQQLTEKIEQVLGLVAAMRTSPVSTPEILKANLILLMNTVWSESGLRFDSKSITFQVGLHEQLIACSMRWAGSSLDFKNWLQPEEKWHPLFINSLITAVQLNGDTQETEVILLLADMQTRKTFIPVIVDVLTVARLRVAPDLNDQAASFEFEYFENNRINKRLEQAIGKV